MRSSKKFLAVPSHGPDVPRQQRERGIRIFHLSSNLASLLVMFHFRRNPSGAQVSDEIAIVGKKTQDHSGTSNPQSSTKAEGETDPCGAMCHKQHNDAVELEHAQRLSSNPRSPLSTDAHILACVHSTGQQEALGEFFTHLCFRKSSRTSTVSVRSTLP